MFRERSTAATGPSTRWSSSEYAGSAVSSRATPPRITTRSVCGRASSSLNRRAPGSRAAAGDGVRTEGEIGGEYPRIETAAATACGKVVLRATEGASHACVIQVKMKKTE